MKASEITKPGYYWYRDRGGETWTVGLVVGGIFFYNCGSDEFEVVPFAAGELAEAEFVGPLNPPGDQFRPSEHAVAQAFFERLNRLPRGENAMSFASMVLQRTVEIEAGRSSEVTR